MKGYFFMLIADFSAKIEEVLSQECTKYECNKTNSDDVGLDWSFVIEDSISGYIFVEKNVDTFNMPTVSIGLYLMDVTDATKDELAEFLALNHSFLNASVALTTVPNLNDLTDQLDENSTEDEIAEAISDAPSKDILTIQTRIPLEAFEPDDFVSLIQNLLFQFEIFSSAEEDDEDSSPIITNA